MASQQDVQLGFVFSMSKNRKYQHWVVFLLDRVWRRHRQKPSALFSHSYPKAGLSPFDMLQIIKRFISSRAQFHTVFGQMSGQSNRDRFSAPIFSCKHLMFFSISVLQNPVSSRLRWWKLIGSRERESTLVSCFCCSIWERFLLPDRVTSQPCLCYSASLDALLGAAAWCDSAVVHPV